MHTYTMKDCHRERYIFYLAVVAFGIIAVGNQVAGYLGVAASITSFSAFCAVYIAFDRWIWRLPLISNAIGIPVLAGDWQVVGSTSGADGIKRDWQAIARIEQTWSRISICLESELSRSRSGIAAIECDSGHGFRLIYGFSNELRKTDSGLTSHKGTCEVIFSVNLQHGEGTYFTDHQRRTYGTMSWTKLNILRTPEHAWIRN